MPLSHPRSNITFDHRVIDPNQARVDAIFRRELDSDALAGAAHFGVAGVADKDEFRRLVQHEQADQAVEAREEFRADTHLRFWGVRYWICCSAYVRTSENLPST